MRVTILVNDSVVYVEEQPLRVDLDGIDDDVHAVQWYGEAGEVEFKTNYIDGSRRPNERITDFSEYQIFVDRWLAAAQNAP